MTDSEVLFPFEEIESNTSDDEVFFSGWTF